MEPLVSVIMSTFNEKIEWVDGAINSILKQSFGEFEFIIVLDNPERSDIKELVSSYKLKDERIIIIENLNNIGLVKSLNKALTLCRGKYIARMDSDDVSHLNRLQVQFRYLEENKGIDFIGAKVKYINEKDEPLNDYKNVLATDHSKLKRLLAYGNSFNHPTWFFKKEILRDIKEYREIKFAEDYDFVTRVVTCNYKVGNIDEILLDYRVRESGISQSNYFEQMRVSMVIARMYKKRLQGISEQKASSNLNKQEKASTSKNFYRATVYEKKYKSSRGIKKIVYFITAIMSSGIFLRGYFNKKIYTFLLCR
jgi:glycosyltransferase involved in cell wall biosynthesis